jgi:(S)-3,5-dihydroxyphenylglycine transaminase
MRPAHLAELELEIHSLHSSLVSPVGESMNFLNEVAQRFPDAVSFAAGRPFEGYFDLDLIHRYLEVYRGYLTERLGGDEVAVRRQILQYGRTKGVIHELIAENLRVDEGITADPDSIVVTVGCQEALYLTLRALRRDERDVLLAVAPSYVGVYGAAELVDMTVLPVRDDGAGLDLDDLAAAIVRARAAGLRPRACYVVPDFSNPSGASLDLETRRGLLRLAEEHDILVLEDNPYGIFGDGSGPPTLKALDQHRRVVYLGTYAKSGVPGARVGFVVADQRVQARPDPGAAADDGADPAGVLLADLLSRLKSMLTVNTSPIAQAVIGGKLLEHGCSLREANTREIQVYQGNLDRILRGLAARFPAGTDPVVTWNSPAGGFFCVLTVPFPADNELMELSAAKYQVLWTPMHQFYAQTEPRREIRLSYSHLVPHEIDEGLDRLAAFVRDQAATHP